MSYTVWMKGQVGIVSPAPCFRGTKREAEAMLRQIEQEEPRLRGKMEVGKP